MLFVVADVHATYACTPKPSQRGCPERCFTSVTSYTNATLTGLVLKVECYNDTRCIPTSAHMYDTNQTGRLSFGGKCLSATADHHVIATECDEDSKMQRFAFKTWVPKDSYETV